MMREEGQPRIRATSVEKLIPDPRHDITEKVIKTWRRFVGSEWKLTNTSHNKFIETTKILLQKLGPNPDDFHVDSLLQDLFDVLKLTYTDKAAIVQPGMFCSDHTWTNLMPQYFVNIPQVKMYDYDKQSSDEWDGIVAEEEQLTKDIETNMRRQCPNIEPEKPISDADSGLGYMMNL